jgi:hypothetical protein
MRELYELPEGVSVMCAFCLRQATHFYVHIPTHGELIAVCDREKPRK